MSNDLNIPQLAENQTRPDLTTNDATAAVGNAIANKFDCDLTSGNVLVTSAQYRASILFRAINVATGGRTVTLPQVEREFVLVECDSGNTNTVDLIRGSTTFTMTPGRLYVVRTDGTSNGLVVRDIGGTDEPADMSLFVPGIMSNNQLLYSGKALRAWALPATAPGSYGYFGTAVTASTTITIKKNGSSVGTLVVATGTAGAFTVASLVNFAVGDTLSIHGPATADTTAADFSLGLKGKRTP